LRAWRISSFSTSEKNIRQENNRRAESYSKIKIKEIKKDKEEEEEE
jgi:hypothetical protein